MIEWSAAKKTLIIDSALAFHYFRVYGINVLTVVIVVANSFLYLPITVSYFVAAILGGGFRYCISSTC